LIGVAEDFGQEGAHVGEDLSNQVRVFPEKDAYRAALDSGALNI
jgi:hypothetical protein